jgi:hypothetical protein
MNLGAQASRLLRKRPRWPRSQEKALAQHVLRKCTSTERNGETTVACNNGPPVIPWRGEAGVFIRSGQVHDPAESETRNQLPGMHLTRIDNVRLRLVSYEYANWTCKGPLWTKEMPQSCCSRNCTGHERSRGHCGGVHGQAACRTPGSQETWSNERRHPLLRNGRWRKECV